MFGPRLIDYTGAFIAGYALLALVIGWGLGVDTIVRGSPNSVAMVPSTALCFIMLGSCMMTVRLQTTIEVLIFSISLIGMFIFFGFVVGHNLSDPNQSFVDVLNVDLHPVDGMALGTAMGISLLALALVILAIGQSKLGLFVSLLAGAVALQLLVAVSSKMWSPDIAFVSDLYGQMSIPTLILLFTATIGLAGFSLTAHNQ